jgi:hypothetical protein
MRSNGLVVLAQLLVMVIGSLALATPLLRVVNRERLDRPHQWRVVISAAQPSSLESTSVPKSRLLGTYTFIVNCETRWLRDISGGVARPPRPLNQLWGYPTGVPQIAFVAACGENALREYSHQMISQQVLQ